MLDSLLVLQSDMTDLLGIVEWTSLVSLVIHGVGAVVSGITLLASAILMQLNQSYSLAFLGSLTGTITLVFGTVGMVISLLNMA